MAIENTTDRGLPANIPAQAQPANTDEELTFEFSDEEIDALVDDIEDDNPVEFYDNLVDDISEEGLDSISDSVIGAYEADEESRKTWMQSITDGLELLGTELDDTNVPFEGACGAHHPLIIENAVKFQSKASAELLPADGPVKTQVLGVVANEREQSAQRVGQHMNWQLTTQMEEYYPDKEKMLFYLPIIGSGFGKMYWNSALASPCSEFVPVDQFVVPFNATDLKRASRYTQIIYKTSDDLKKDVSHGFYTDVLDDIGEPSKVELTDFQQRQGEITGVLPSSSEHDSGYTLLEQHVSLYIPDIDEDEDELAKPYIITVDKMSSKVLGVRRNWREEDPTFEKKMWFVHYPFVPGMGFYGLGFIHLLGNIQKTLTSALRALVDAGQFANLPAGLKTKGVRSTADDGPLQPGEWRDVESAGQKLSEAFFALPYKEPSSTLFNLMQWLDGRGQKFADSTEQVIADSSNYGPVGTTMALLDASTKFFSAIHKRIHFAQKRELKILAEINREYLDEQIEYDVPEATLYVTREDYSNKVAILPVSDPNISSSAQRLTMETTKMQMVQANPDIKVNKEELFKRALLAMGEKEIDKILPPEEEAKPQDPVADIFSAIKGMSIKAFEGQNHDAHMQVKSAWLEDPMNGGTPVMQKVAPILQSNIQEHLIMRYQEQINAASRNVQITGAATDPQTKEQVTAQAAKVIAENNKAAQAKLREGSPEDKLAEAELLRANTDVKKLDHTRKRDIASLLMDGQRLRLDREKEANDHEESREKLATDLSKVQFKAGSEMIKEAVKDLRESDRRAVGPK